VVGRRREPVTVEVRHDHIDHELLAEIERVEREAGKLAMLAGRDA